MLIIEIYKYLMVAASHLAAVWRIYMFRVKSDGHKKHFLSKSKKRVEELAQSC
jgi:hypothetical protein